ncbi:hypothetical protein F4779DRAFT_624165 [Xylariaceae sp. FL0662B]|nr:hypothetical protein F4779DRAFT_624165 [Xylariaceae sp. FL0662B]
MKIDKGMGEQKSSTKVDALSASAFIPLQFENGTICWFELRQNELGVNSPTFNYIAEQASQATIFASQASSTAASSSEANSATTTAQEETTVTLAENDGQQSSSGLPVPAQAGIGIGACIAGIGLGAVAAIMYFAWRQRRVSKDREKLRSDDSEAQAPPGTTTNCYYSQSQRRAHEMHGFDPVWEPSTVYPYGSASTLSSRPRSIHSIDRDYLTDFAMADRQIWTDHTRSNSPAGPTAPLPAITVPGGPYELDSTTTNISQRVPSGPLPESRRFSYEPQINAMPP